MKIRHIEWIAWLALVVSFFTLVTLLYVVTPNVLGAVSQQSGTIAGMQLSSAPSEIGQTFNYQGILRNNKGGLLTGVYTVTVKIYAEPTAGVALFTQSTSNVVVSDGVFNVVLGNTQGNLLNSSVFAASPRYLGIAIAPDAEMIPRQEIHAVPWALMATTALTANSALVADEAATVPNASITTDKLADGAVTGSKLKMPYGTQCLSEDYTIKKTTTGSQTFMIPGLSLPFTLTTDSNVLIWIDGTARFVQTAGSDAGVSLEIDDYSITADVFNGSDYWWNIHGQRIVSLTAGEHQLTSKFIAWDPGTAFIRGLSHWHTCVNYLVLGS